MEGAHNALAAWGYQRDGHKGTRQIVLGGLCAEDGHPVSLEVVPGNTQAPQTCAAQITQGKARFGVHASPCGGDRGMRKGPQSADLAPQGLPDMTAMTPPQLETLLPPGPWHRDRSAQAVAEVLAAEGLRYVLRRHPLRAHAVRDTRHAPLATLQAHVAQQHPYLADYRRANAQGALPKLVAKADQRRHADGGALPLGERALRLTRKEDAQHEAA